MPVFFGRPFLLILCWQVDLEVIIGAVEVRAAEIPFIVILIAVVEELDIFFIGLSYERTTVINLIFRHGNAVVQMREDSRNGPGFRAGIYDPCIDKLRHHVINAELKAHLGGKDVNRVFYMQFCKERMQEEMSHVYLHRLFECTWPCFLSMLCRPFLFAFFYILLVVSDRIGNIMGDQLIHVTESLNAFGTGLLFILIPICFIHL